MILLQKEFAEGRVSNFSSAFWRILPTNKTFLSPTSKRKENKLLPVIKNGLYGIVDNLCWN